MITQASISIGDSLVNSKDIIPLPKFNAERIQEIYSLDSKLLSQEERIESVIADIEDYFQKAQLSYFDNFSNKYCYYYIDNENTRQFLIHQILDIKNRLVSVDLLKQYLNDVKSSINFDTSAGIDESDIKTLEKCNILKNELEQIEKAANLERSKLAEIEAKLNSASKQDFDSISNNKLWVHFLLNGIKKYISLTFYFMLILFYYRCYANLIMTF